MTKILATVGLIALAALGEVKAEPNKVLYELQERCGKQATEWFVSEWGRSGIVNTNDGQIIADFQNHYNSKLNTCIVLLNTTNINTKKPKPTTFRRVHYLMYLRTELSESAGIQEVFAWLTAMC
jgi:hypothetical protein